VDIIGEGTRVKLEGGEWRIDELPDGWVLRVRPRVGLFEYAPQILPPGSRRVFWPLLALLTALPTIIGHMPAGAAAILSALVCACGLSAWLLPRLGGGYENVSRTMSVPFRGGAFDTIQGHFSISTLATLRTDCDDALPGRVRLVFDGHVVPGNDLIGWPGLDSETAEAVRQAVLARSGVNGPTGESWAVTE